MDFKISVIMPCYNMETYVGEALDSVLTQNIEPIEIICIDDGSEDGTLDVLREYEKHHDNVFIIADTNHGQGYQRNVGMELARGQYIYFMDSDDKLVPGALERLYKCAAEQDLDVLFFEGTSIYETEELEEQFPQYKTLYHRKKEQPGVWNGKQLYMAFEEAGQFIVMPCMQFTKKEHLMKKNIRFMDVPSLEDNIYTLESLLAADRAACISDALYIRRVRANSTMTRIRKSRFETYWTITCRLLQILESYQGQTDMENALCMRIRRVCRNILNDYDRLGEEEQKDYFEGKDSEKLDFLRMMERFIVIDGSRLMQEKNEVRKKANEERKKANEEKQQLSNRLAGITEEKRQIERQLSESVREREILGNRFAEAEEKISQISLSLENTENKLGRLNLEKTETEEKLQKAMEDNAELGILLQKTYREKAERGRTIKEFEKEKKELEAHFLVRVDRKLRRIWREIQDRKRVQ